MQGILFCPPGSHVDILITLASEEGKIKLTHVVTPDVR
jgi:Flp pilus assembly protein CpaB